MLKQTCKSQLEEGGVCLSMYNFCYGVHMVFWKKLFWKFVENSQKNIRYRARISILASLQVGEYAEYCISSKKRQTSNKRDTFGYPH